MNESWASAEVLSGDPTFTPTFKYACCVLALLISSIYFAKRLKGDRQSGLHKIPGPQGLPLLGSILDLRKGHAKTFNEWTKKYGNVIRVVLGSKEVVVLNTRSAIAKTMVQQGSNFQTRPTWSIWHETFVHSANTGGVLTMGTSKWSPNISKLRKLLAPHTTAPRLPRFNHFVSRRYLRLIKLLSDTKSKPLDLGFTIWSTTIGLETDQLVGQIHDEDFVRLICQTEIGIFRLRALGRPYRDWVPLLDAWGMLADAVIPQLRRAVQFLGFSVPEFLRKTRYEKCDDLRVNQSKYCKKQLSGLIERIKNGDKTPSQLGDLFRALPERLPPIDEYLLITTLSGSGMAIGTTLNWLMGYLASHPELQDAAYNALHKVYNGEVPDPHDTDRVEYIKALAIEAGRVWVPIRLGFFRATDRDSQVDGYSIPEGTPVVYNSFQINRDPAGYDQPDKFIPERWMNGHQGRTDTKVVEDKIGVPHMGHGAGRRYCLGVPNVNKSFYGILSLTLHFFKLERAELDSEGMQNVFPTIRACRQTSPSMDPIYDQISQVEAQAIPCATGIRLTPRDPQQLASWINEEHRSLQDFDAPSSY